MALNKRKITVSRYSGFCDGVQRAFEMVQRASQDTKARRPIFVLDSLVHNNEVVKKIEKMGIKKINFPKDPKKFFNSLKKNQIGTLIITAHGVDPKIYALAKKKRIDIIDTTCPKVIKVQRLAKIHSERGNQVVLVGEKKHKEIRGIFGWSGKKAIIIENENDAKKIILEPRKPIIIISQTTQKQDLINRIVKIIKKKYPQAEFINTLCLATQNRQNEIKKLARKNEVVIVVGSKESANSTHLWEIAKKINPQSYFIQKAKDLEKIELKNAITIGVSAGASTPQWIIEEAFNFLNS
jgi:4-hydroxy-3-methylbut-2-en-1-yl diphosphate reductase